MIYRAQDHMPTEAELVHGAVVYDGAPNGFGKGIVVGRISHWREGWGPGDGYLYLVEHPGPNGNGVTESRYMRWRLRMLD